MKRMYEMPRAFEEGFMANEYVAACYNYHAELYCAIPGDSKSYVNDGTKIRVGPQDGHDHGGPCTTNNSCDITGNTGMENSTGHAISNVVLGEIASNGLGTKVNNNIGRAPSTISAGYYKATWENYDDAHLFYHHYGIAKVTSVEQIPGRPNHS